MRSMGIPDYARNRSEETVTASIASRFKWEWGVNFYKIGSFGGLLAQRTFEVMQHGDKKGPAVDNGVSSARPFLHVGIVEKARRCPVAAAAACRSPIDCYRLPRWTLNRTAS